jgi:hypothetical protein
MPKQPIYWVFLCGAALALLNLQSCNSFQASLPPEQAFALSASALSGIDNYTFDGEVTMFDPTGIVGSKAAYIGEVKGHKNVKLQWKNANMLSIQDKSQSKTSYQPLQLLESINSKNAVIAYAEPPSSNRPVHFLIKLDETVARDRVIAGLRADFALISKKDVLLRRDPVKANKIISQSKKRLEAALATLKVTTVCDWTAEPKNWLPRRVREETVLAYKWDDKPCTEKRISETNFLHSGRDGTIKKVNY